MLDLRPLLYDDFLAASDIDAAR